jgi:hypothetical protein
LGWSTSEKKNSIAEYKEIIERQNAELIVAKKEKSKVS